MVREQVEIIFGANTAQADRAMQSFQSRTAGVAKSISGSFTAALAGVASIGWFKSVMDSTGHVQDLSQGLQVASDKLFLFAAAGEDSGATVDDFAGSFLKLSRAAKAAQQDVGGDMAQSFARLGVSIDDLKSKSLDDIMLQIAGTFHRADDAQKLLADGLIVLGRGALPLIQAFNDDFVGAVEKAKKSVGEFVSKERIADVDAYGDKFGEFGRKIKAATIVVISEVKRMHDALARPVQSVTEFDDFLSNISKPGNKGETKSEQILRQWKELQDTRNQRSHDERVARGQVFGAGGRSKDALDADGIAASVTDPSVEAAAATLLARQNAETEKLTRLWLEIQDLKERSAKIGKTETEQLTENKKKLDQIKSVWEAVVSEEGEFSETALETQKKIVQMQSTILEGERVIAREKMQEQEREFRANEELARQRARGQDLWGNVKKAGADLKGNFAERAGYTLEELADLPVNNWQVSEANRALDLREWAHTNMLNFPDVATRTPPQQTKSLHRFQVQARGASSDSVAGEMLAASLWKNHLWLHCLFKLVGPPLQHFRHLALFRGCKAIHGAP